MKQLIWIYMAMISLVSTVGVSNAAEWELKKEKHGIKAYTRSVEGSKHLAFKGVAKFEASLDSLVRAHRNVPSMSQWLHTCYEPVVVEDEGEWSRIIHMKNSVPSWALGVSDRDLVLKQDIDQVDDKRVVITLTGIPDYISEKDGYVRIPYFYGGWEFLDLGDGNVQVSYEGQIDPGGYLLSAVTNAMVVDTPYESLNKLRKYVRAKQSGN